MKASRFSDAQKFILKQGADGMPVADICRKTGIRQSTLSLSHIKSARIDGASRREQGAL